MADRLIISAASPAFGPSLLALMGSLNHNWPDHPPVMVYDLGLDQATLESLAAFAVPVRPVPAFCGHWRKHFAWKVWCLWDAPARDVLWMDAGMAVLDPLEEAFTAIDALGYFVTPINGQLVQQVPAAAIRACGLSDAFVAGRPMLAASLIGFRKEGVGRTLLREARELVLDEQNVAAQTSAHRHDQALLSLLLYKHHRHVVAADQRLYLNWRSPTHTIGQKVWHHRRRMLAADVEFLSRQSQPLPSRPYVPRSPPPRSTVPRVAAAVYDGVREPSVGRADDAARTSREPVRRWRSRAGKWLRRGRRLAARVLRGLGLRR